MPFIDFGTTKRIQIWEGISGAFHHSEQLTFGHITLVKDVVVPEHKHVHEQWTHVLAGELEFTLDGKTMVLKPGMAVHIPSEVPHGARAITECNVMDCFLPVREDFVDLAKKSE